MSRRRGLWAATALCLSVLTACSGTAEPEPTPSQPTSSTPPPPMVTTPVASDGGSAQIAETGLTVAPDTDGTGAEYWWAVAIKNTSATDLLVTVDFDRGDIDAGGQKHGQPNKLHTILPGQTIYTGRRASSSTVPVKLDPTIVASRWYPMSELTGRGFNAGLELTEGAFVSETGTYVRAAYISRHVGVPDQVVDILVVLRDGKGLLRGALRVNAHGSALPAGPHVMEDSFDADDWPPGADRAKSQITISSTCCAIIPD